MMHLELAKDITDITYPVYLSVYMCCIVLHCVAMSRHHD